MKDTTGPLARIGPGTNVMSSADFERVHARVDRGDNLTSLGLALRPRLQSASMAQWQRRFAPL